MGTGSERKLRDYARDNANSADRTRPVGGEQPNAPRRFDMSGNFWGWMVDLCGEALSLKDVKDIPRGTGKGVERL